MPRLPIEYGLANKWIQFFRVLEVQVVRERCLQSVTLPIENLCLGEGAFLWDEDHFELVYSFVSEPYFARFYSIIQFHRSFSSR